MMNTARAEYAAGRGFLGVAALLFLGSVAAVIRGSLAMSGMGALPMPGGWLLSMVWLRACGRDWAGSAVDFLLMWVVMMAAMMLPSLVPVLWCRRRLGGRFGVALAGGGYFLVWAGFGLLVFATGAAVAAGLDRVPELARAVPLVAGLVVTAGGAAQFTAWKLRHLARCRADCMPVAGAAWRFGLRLGLHCAASSAGLTAILLAFGLMDLRAMLLVTLAITSERLAPDAARAAKAIGVVAILAGLALVLRAAG